MKNNPAMLTYPLYSPGSDLVMFWHKLTGQINKKIKEAEKIFSFPKSSLTTKSLLPAAIV